MEEAAAKGGIRAGWIPGAATLLACLAVIAATPNDAYWIVDCGAKALLAERFVATDFRSLAFDYPARALDPAGEAFPIPPPFAVEHALAAERSVEFVSQYPPAYPAVAAPFLAWLGPAGLRIPAALGAALCAFLFAVWTAPVFGVRWARAGGLVLGLATPLFFYGVTVWEHALTVALVLGAVVAVARRNTGRLVFAGALVALAGWFREETLLALPALALGCFARDRSWRDVARIAAGALPIVGALLAFNTAAYGDPLGVHVAVNLQARPPFGASLQHLGALLAAQGATPAEGVAIAGATFAAIAIGAVLGRSERTRNVALAFAALVGGAIWLRGSTAIFGADVPFIALVRFNGLAVQLPLLCLVGIGGARVVRNPDYAALRPGIVAGILFAVFFIPFRVTVSDFASGGHWGPRMLLPALPALVALALAALHRPAADPNRAGRAVLGLVLGAGLLSSALAAHLLDTQKREARSLEQHILANPEPVVVTTHPALGQQLAGMWDERPLLLARDKAHLSAIAASLGQRDVPEFLLVWRLAPGIAPPHIDGVRCHPRGRHTGTFVRRVFDVALFTCVLPKTTSSRS